eukprot:3499358-Pleurochrysis_carterae.AAC.1
MSHDGKIQVGYASGTKTPNTTESGIAIRPARSESSTARPSGEISKKLYPLRVGQAVSYTHLRAHETDSYL